MELRSYDNTFLKPSEEFFASKAPLRVERGSYGVIKLWSYGVKTTPY